MTTISLLFFCILEALWVSFLKITIISSKISIKLVLIYSQNPNKVDSYSFGIKIIFTFSHFSRFVRIFVIFKMTQIKFLGAIWQETVKHFGHDIEERKTPDTYDLYRHNRRHEMRGANHIVRTHWWLAQGKPGFFVCNF